MGALIESLSDELIKLKTHEEQEKNQNPFKREIFLCNSYIAGTQYYKTEKSEKGVEVDEKLTTKRTPWNKYDSFAIALYNSKGEQLGHMPRSDNEVFARLMDAGKSIVVYVNEVKWQERFLNISIRVFLLDY